ncbi:helix-turn-helix domain-containing protein [Limibacterium fermenti]|uniref:helix-turn-helix domain-containing protein n=1 Tax=Limibacterium fermenti TaxID=3229863 RepID=UPI003A5ED302
MIAESREKVSRRHIGRNVQRVRTYLGMKQEALAADLGISQQEVSKIENQDEIEEGLLSRIAEILGVSPEVIKDFDAEKIIYNIDNSYKDATISEGGTAIVLQINPIEKIVELYERLLQSEHEKIELLKNK